MSNVPALKVLARLYPTVVGAVVAGTVAVMLTSAAINVRLDPGGAFILMVAGMWIPQQLITAGRYRRP